MFANILNLVLTKQNTLSYSCYDLVTLLVIVLVPGHIFNKKKTIYYKHSKYSLIGYNQRKLKLNVLKENCRIPYYLVLYFEGFQC